MKETEYAEKLKFYSSMLPHGYKALVAERAGVRRATVSEFFRGKYYSKRVEDTILDVIVELQEERKNRLKRAGII